MPKTYKPRPSTIERRNDTARRRRPGGGRPMADDEAHAMNVMQRLMDVLTPEARRRVAQYAANRWGGDGTDPR